MAHFPLFPRREGLGTIYYCNQCRAVRALVAAEFHAEDRKARKTLTKVVSRGYCEVCRSKLEHAQVFEDFHRGRLTYLGALLGAFLLLLLGVSVAPTERISDTFMIWTGVAGLVLLIHILICVGLLFDGRNWVIQTRLDPPPSWPAGRLVDKLVRELQSSD